MILKKRKGSSSFMEINMTPMIDAVFLLLIFFMVTTVMKNPAQLKMLLPEAKNYAKLDVKQLNLEVNAAGEMALNGQKLSIDSFDAYLVGEKAKTGNNALLIKADVATKHGLILKIMQIAKGVGIETINMAIDNKADINKK